MYEHDTFQKDHQLSGKTLRKANTAAANDRIGFNLFLPFCMQQQLLPYHQTGNGNGNGNGYFRYS